MKKFLISLTYVLICSTDYSYSIEDLESSIKDLISQKLDHNCEELEITFARKKMDFYNENIQSLELLDLYENDRTAKINVFLINDIVKTFTIYYDGYLDVLVSDKFLKTGHIISLDDFKTSRMKISKIGSDFLTKDQKNLTNMRVKKNISKNKVIRRSDLAEAFLVNVNDIVYAVYQHTSLNLRMQALALSAGSCGDYIKIKNIASSNVLYGKILNNKTILID